MTYPEPNRPSHDPWEFYTPPPNPQFPATGGFDWNVQHPSAPGYVTNTTAQTWNPAGQPYVPPEPPKERRNILPRVIFAVVLVIAIVSTVSFYLQKSQADKLGDRARSANTQLAAANARATQLQEQTGRLAAQLAACQIASRDSDALTKAWIQAMLSMARSANELTNGDDQAALDDANDASAQVAPLKDRGDQVAKELEACSDGI